jgi:YVTN family beta-propeller protein
MKKFIKYIFLLTITALTFTSCSKDDSTPVTPPLIESTAGLYIINEGVYGQNNSEISYLDFSTGTVSKNLYAQANGSSLGDNANSMYVYGDKGYIAVDNSNKIEIVNLKSYKSLGFIDLGTGSSPREIYIKDTTAGYVTSLYTDKVIKFNPSTKTVLKSIAVGGKPEGLVEANGKLYVANSGFGSANTLSVIDLASDNVTATLKIGLNPRVLVKGSDNNVYAVCTGAYPPADPNGMGSVYKINSTTSTVSDSLIVSGNPGEACDVNGEIWVVNTSGIVKANFVNRTVSATPVITGMNVNGSYGIIYSICYDKTTQTVYCGNPKNFTQNGEVVAFSTDGTEKNRFTSGGINPGTLVIKKN